MPRTGPIDVAALSHRREAFLGPLKEREARAKHLIVQGRSAKKDDLATALELARRVPLPILNRLIDEGVEIKIDRDPAERVLRELATSIDRSLGRGETRWSSATPAFVEACAADAGRLPAHLAGDGARIFVELLGRYLGHDATLAAELPALHAALVAMLDKEAAAEEARLHPVRIKRVMSFLRTHVLLNPKLSEGAKASLARRAQREAGPWDQTEMERHAKGVREGPGEVLVDTRWGAEPYPIEGRLDPSREQALLDLFLEKFVRSSARISPKGKERLERGAALAYGPWRASDFDKHVTGVFESRNRFVVQTKAGNVTVELG